MIHIQLQIFLTFLLYFVLLESRLLLSNIGFPKINTDSVDSISYFLDNVITNAPFRLNQLLIKVGYIVFVNQFEDLSFHLVGITSQLRKRNLFKHILIVLAHQFLNLFLPASNPFHMSTHLEYILFDEGIDARQEFFQLVLQETNNLLKFRAEALHVLLGEVVDL